MRGLCRERYHDFTAQHFHEVSRREHDYKLGYTVTRLALQSAGLMTKAVRRGVHRKKRVRRPMPGMLLFQDGSTHCWLPAPGGGAGDPEVKQDLIVTMDDATGAIHSIFLVAQEGTASSFQGLSDVISEHGLFSAFYTDRGSHYFHTPKAGGKEDKSHLTQVGRALAQLGIRHLPSYSPEAPKGAIGADGTGVRHVAEPHSPGTARPGSRHDGGGECVSARSLHGRLQRPLRGHAGGA